jgi:hypothetical protein
MSEPIITYRGYSIHPVYSLVEGQIHRRVSYVINDPSGKELNDEFATVDVAKRVIDAREGQSCETKTDDELRTELIRLVKVNALIPMPMVVHDMISGQEDSLDGYDMRIITHQVGKFVRLTIDIPVENISHESLVSLCEFGRSNEG